MSEQYIAVIECADDDYEVKVFDAEGAPVLERPYFCRGYDAAMETAKLIRRAKFPQHPIFKQPLEGEVIKVLG